MSDAMAARLDYWRERLAGLPAMELPADRPRTDEVRGLPASHEFRVPAWIARGFSTLGKAHGGSLFTGLFTACQVVFSRYGRQEDLALATAAPSGSTVAVRGAIWPEMPFEQLLADNAEAIEEAFVHQDVPLGEVGTAGFGADAVRVSVTIGETAMEPVAFDVAVVFTETRSGGLTGRIDYDTALFDASTVRRLARHLIVLLTAAAADPSAPVGDLPLLDGEELRTLIVDWAVNRTDYPGDRCLHELIGDHVRDRPDAVAVVDGATTLTYAELDARAARLAHLLVSSGVRPGGIVAVCLPRGAELIAAMLGILQSGCAYLPLDPAFPADRLIFQLTDAGAAACVTKAPLAEQLGAAGTPLICLDDRRADLGAGPAGRPEVEVTSRDGAQVMYTSGSTGTPKGALIEHRSIVRLVCAADWVELRPDDVVVQGANVIFDAATFEVWAPLVAGARMVVLDKATLLDPAALRAALAEHGVTTLFLTPAVLNQVVAADPGSFGDLRYLFTGGEVMSPSRAAQILAARPPEHLVNLYGPTETTMLATWHPVREVDEHASVPIGRPTSNTTVYVLDDRLHPVPIGVPGELFVAGPGVARGYVNRPGLTAERFIQNPFAGEPDDRLYRTGDLVRWRPDGVIEYLGRVDEQVKVRGHRIEPQEIELTLERHPEVAAAVVVARGDGEHKRLVGYVRPTPAGRPEGRALREFAAERLPDYMVPAAVMVLDEFPLNASGKVDRAALPEPEVIPAGSAGIAPRSSTERLLADIWADVLGLAQVGVTDNFYELGGDSVLGIKVVARAKRAGLTISSKEIFRRQTIAELAAVAVASDDPAGRADGR